MRIIKKEYNKFLANLIVFLLILASKTVFFGIIHMQSTMLVCLLALIIFGIYLSRDRNMFLSKKTIEHLLIFLVSLLMVSLFYIQDILVDFKSYVGALILFAEVLVIGFFTVNLIKKDDFIKAYVHIMSGISIISLFYFTWSLVDKNAVRNLCEVYVDGTSKFIAMPWYTYGSQKIMENGYVYNYMFGRNAGPFWEPGAFQFFLMIALFMILGCKELFTRRRFLVILLLLTLITTQSTSAYIILLVSLLGYSGDYIECLFGETWVMRKSKNVQIIIYVATFLFVVVLAATILLSGNIAQKFDVDNGSFIVRMSDITGSLETLLYNPIAGIGRGATGEAIRADATAAITTTTVLTLAMYYGIPFAIFYFYRFMSGCFSFYRPNTLRKKVVIIVAFSIALLSETLYLLPISAVFLFVSLKKSEKT